MDSFLCGSSESVPISMAQPVATYIFDRNGLFREGLSRLLQGTLYEPLFHGTSMPPANSNSVHFGRNSLVIFGPDSDGPGSALLGSPQNDHSYRTVVLFNPHSERQVVERFGRSANSFLLVTISVEMLVKSLDLVMDGLSVLSPGVAALFVAPATTAGECVVPTADVAGASQEAVNANSFSERESLVLRHLTRGASNKIIARDLGIAEATVKVHVKAIFRKACLRNRTQVALWAMKQYNGEGLLPINPALALDPHSSGTLPVHVAG